MQNGGWFSDGLLKLFQFEATKISMFCHKIMELEMLETETAASLLQIVSLIFVVVFRIAWIVIQRQWL